MRHRKILWIPMVALAAVVATLSVAPAQAGVGHVFDEFHLEGAFSIGQFDFDIAYGRYGDYDDDLYLHVRNYPHRTYNECDGGCARHRGKDYHRRACPYFSEIIDRYRYTPAGFYGRYAPKRWANVNNRGYKYRHGKRYSQGIPARFLPPPGLYRVWFDGLPAWRQPAPMRYNQAKRFKYRYGGRLIYPAKRYARGHGHYRYKNDYRYKDDYRTKRKHKKRRHRGYYDDDSSDDWSSDDDSSDDYRRRRKNRRGY